MASRSSGLLSQRLRLLVSWRYVSQITSAFFQVDLTCYCMRWANSSYLIVDGCMSLMMWEPIGYLTGYFCSFVSDVLLFIVVQKMWRGKLRYFRVSGNCWNFCQHCHLIVACPWWCPALFFSSSETNRQDIFVCCEFVMKKCKERQTVIVASLL